MSPKKTWVAGSSPAKGYLWLSINTILQPNSLNRTAVGLSRGSTWMAGKSGHDGARETVLSDRNKRSAGSGADQYPSGLAAAHEIEGRIDVFQGEFIGDDAVEG